MSFEIGDIVAGQYRLDGLLGEGGMGAVYRATHVGLAEAVAVKVIRFPPGHEAESIFLERFEREARVAFQLRHDNAVRVLDFGEDGGTPYLVMEYLDGRPLAAEMEGRVPVEPVERALRIALQLADVLVEMHGQSLVHRDLKPENVILIEDGSSSAVERLSGSAKSENSVKNGSGSAVEPLSGSANGENGVVRPVIVDFGLAYLADSETLGRVTQGGEVVGTPYYIAPEQGRGEATIGPAADVYAFGCVLFEMLSGQVPFSEGSAAELVSKHMYVPPPPLDEARGAHREALPAKLVELVGRMLEKGAGDRPSSEEVYETLGRVLHGEREWKRGRPREFLKERSERAVEDGGADKTGGDVGPSGRSLMVGVAGDIEEDWRMALGSAGLGCRRIARDDTVDEAGGVDVVFVPEADPETIASVASFGPVLAGCDPSDLAGATALLQTAAVEVITQPVDASELVEKVERVWRKKKRRENG